MNELHPHEASTDNQHSWKPISELTEKEINALFAQLEPPTEGIKTICYYATVWSCPETETGGKRIWLDKLSEYAPVAIG